MHRALIRPNTLDPLTFLGSYLIEMWDAERSDLITIATGVSAWNGIKLGLSATQGTGANQPILSATSFNGAAGVTFDGTNDVLSYTLTGEFPATSVGSELWALFSQDAAVADTNVRQVMSYGSAASTTARAIQRNVNTSRNIIQGSAGDGSAQQVTVATTVMDISYRHVVRWQVRPDSQQLTIDGVKSNGNIVVPNTTATRFRIGANAAGTAAQFWQGQIAVVAVCNPMPDGIAKAFMNYLMKRRRI